MKKCSSLFMFTLATSVWAQAAPSLREELTPYKDSISKLPDIGMPIEFTRVGFLMLASCGGGTLTTIASIVADTLPVTPLISRSMAGAAGDKLLRRRGINRTGAGEQYDGSLKVAPSADGQAAEFGAIFSAAVPAVADAVGVAWNAGQDGAHFMNPDMGHNKLKICNLAVQYSPTALAADKFLTGETATCRKTVTQFNILLAEVARRNSTKRGSCPVAPVKDDVPQSTH